MLMSLLISYDLREHVIGVWHCVLAVTLVSGRKWHFRTRNRQNSSNKQFSMTLVHLRNKVRKTEWMQLHFEKMCSAKKAHYIHLSSERTWVLTKRLIYLSCQVSTKKGCWRRRHYWESHRREEGDLWDTEGKPKEEAVDNIRGQYWIGWMREHGCEMLWSRNLLIDPYSSCCRGLYLERLPASHISTDLSLRLSQICFDWVIVHMNTSFLREAESVSNHTLCALLNRLTW